MNGLQPPFSDVVGESGPVQKAIKMIWEIFENHPVPNNKSVVSQAAAEQIALHLLGTMNSIGMINAAGYHSAAVTLMRSIEDAFDCLFAVVQSDINAKKWLNGELKASEAASEWTAGKVVDKAIPLGDYRKNIRHGLNNYSHCSPNQTSWNFYRKSDKKGTCRIELNYLHAVISRNGYYIDRYLCIHLYELMGNLPLYYSDYFIGKEEMREYFEKLKCDIETIIKDFLNDIESDRLYMNAPPELEGLSRMSGDTDRNTHCSDMFNSEEVVKKESTAEVVNGAEGKNDVSE